MLNKSDVLARGTAEVPHPGYQGGLAGSSSNGNRLAMPAGWVLQITTHLILLISHCVPFVSLDLTRGGNLRMGLLGGGQDGWRSGVVMKSDVFV